VLASMQKHSIRLVQEIIESYLNSTRVITRVKSKLRTQNAKVKTETIN